MFDNSRPGNQMGSADDMPEPDDLIALALTAAGRDEAGAEQQLTDTLYARLRGRALQLLAGERNDHRLSAGDLVHGAYARLTDGRLPPRERTHFFHAAALAMRRVISGPPAPPSGTLAAGRRSVGRPAGGAGRVAPVTAAAAEWEKCSRRQEPGSPFAWDGPRPLYADVVERPEPEGW